MKPALKNYKESRGIMIPKIIGKWQRPGTVLDAGCGDMVYRKVCDGLNYTPLDFSSNSDPAYVRADLGKELPFLSSSYDYIICTEVLEHLFDPIFAVSEFMRVLTSGGQMIMSAPQKCDLHQEPHIYYSGFFTFWYRRVFQNRADILFLEEYDGGIIIEVKKK